MIKSCFAPKPIEYPALMVYDLCGEKYVVLMHREGAGIVVKSNTEYHPVGKYKDNWLMRVHNHVYFTPYHGQIILENV